MNYSNFESLKAIPSFYIRTENINDTVVAGIKMKSLTAIELSKEEVKKRLDRILSGHVVLTDEEVKDRIDQMFEGSSMTEDEKIKQFNEIFQGGVINLDMSSHDHPRQFELIKAIAEIEFPSPCQYRGYSDPLQDVYMKTFALMVCGDPLDLYKDDPTRQGPEKQFPLIKRALAVTWEQTLTNLEAFGAHEKSVDFSTFMNMDSFDQLIRAEKKSKARASRLSSFDFDEE